MSNQPAPSPVAESASPPKPSPTGQALRIFIGAAIFGTALFFGLSYIADDWAQESTDDAFIDGHVASIAAKVPGEVIATYITENQVVKAGDLLAEIDPRDFDIRVSQKLAALQSAQANQKAFDSSFDLLRARVKTAEAAKKQSDAEAEAAKADYENAQANWKRAENMWSTPNSKLISEQDYDAAKTHMTSAKANWQADLEKAAGDASKVTEARAQLGTAEKLFEQAGAQVSQAEADLKAAELERSYTKITAPVDGRVTRKRLEKGAYVQTGQSLLALVRPEIWVTANFKETQTANIHAGQPVELKVDGSTNRLLHAHVDSLQSGSGARFSLLPPENAVGNFVKVVQRVPVKILFDDPVESMEGFGPGMSVIPTVQVGVRPVTNNVLMAISTAVAFALGLLIWFLKQRPAKA